MSLDVAQLITAVQALLPDIRLRSAQPVEAGAELLLGDGRRARLRFCPSGVDAEVAALRLLAPEIDLPLPQLLGFEASADALGMPFAVITSPDGEPVSQLIEQIGEEQRYAIGRQLGAAIYRVHRIAAPQYGALAGDDPLATSKDTLYTRNRALLALDACVRGGQLDQDLAAQLGAWLIGEFPDKGRRPALVHGDLRPEHLLVRRRERGWVLSGITGWQQAQGWSPGWDHARWLEQSGARSYFALRVGYGNAYDEANDRTYEQVRDHSLSPYRLVLFAERLRGLQDPEQIARLQLRLQVLVNVPPSITDITPSA